MKRLSILLVLYILSNVTLAQSDTLYVLFENTPPNYIIKGSKHKDDPERSTQYPFDGGAIYVIQKGEKDTPWTKELFFSYKSYTPDWMESQFEYLIVNKKYLKKKDFKTSSWFQNNSYERIISIFNNDKVIYLLDKNEFQSDSKIYLVRVYFSFTDEE